MGRTLLSDAFDVGVNVAFFGDYRFNRLSASSALLECLPEDDQSYDVANHGYDVD